MDYNLGDQRKLQYLQNTIGGHVKIFYLDNVQPQVNTYGYALEMINSKKLSRKTEQS